jgi:hypothetical protein
MSTLWLTVGVPATAAIGTAIYTSGGRTALARKAMREELEIAERLPAGCGRTALERIAEERAILYSARWFGPNHHSLRQHALLIGAFFVFGFLSRIAAEDATRPLVGWVATIRLLASVACLGLAVMSLATWVSTVVLAEIAKARTERIAERTDRVNSRLS